MTAGRQDAAAHRLGEGTRLQSDELDAAYGAVLDRYPDLTGEELDRKVRRVAALLRYSADGPAWTAGRPAASQNPTRGTLS